LKHIDVELQDTKFSGVEISSLLGRYAVSTGKVLLTYRKSVVQSSSKKDVSLGVLDPEDDST
jgi:hypothetical protein